MKKPPYRTWIAVMIFFSTFTNYILRSNIAVSIVAMVGVQGKKTIPQCLEDQQITTTVGPNTTLITTSTPTSPTDQVLFNWSEAQVGNIIGCYVYGYIVSILLGGMISELIGPWHVIFWTSVISTICIGLGPLSATLGGYEGLLANRILTGFFGGPVYPAIQVLMAKWAPPHEKGKFMAALMGNTIGTVYAFVVVGQVTYSFGWEWGFYVLAITMTVYCVAFFFIVSDSPDKCRWVSQEERDYIVQCQAGTVSKKKLVAPLGKILINLRFWAMNVAQFGNLWALNLIMTFSTKFMKETLGFNIRDSAGLSALPYLARMTTSIAFGLVGDWMRKKEIMSVTKIRKFFIIFSHFLPAVSLFLIPAAGCNPTGVVALMVLNQAFNGAVVVSHLVNPQDLAPNFAGTLYSIMNFIGMTTLSIVPAVSGQINETKGKTIEAGAIIFVLGGALLSATGVFYIFFGSGEVQKFNTPKEEQQEQ